MNPMTGYAPNPMLSAGMSPQRSQIAALMGNARPIGMPPQMGAPPAMAPPAMPAPTAPMGQPVAPRPMMGMPRSLMR